MSSAEGRGAPVSALLAALARDLTLRWPDRVLTGFEHVMLGRRPRQEEARTLRIEVVRGLPNLVARVLGAEGPALTARVQLADHHPEASAAGVVLPPCGPVPNGARLYALAARTATEGAAESSSGSLRTVRRHGAAGLVAELEVPRSLGKGDWQLNPLGAPAVLEGMLQLAHWGWFTLAGERTHLDGLEHLRCFRLPRAGEQLRLESLLRGASAELPRFDVLCCTVEGAPLISMTGLRLVPRRPVRDVVDRAQWQQFLEALDTHHPQLPGATS